MKKLLFNPFEKFAGWSALCIGIVTILLTALVASMNSIHLDGVLDLHLNIQIPGKSAPAPPTTFLICIEEGLINWLCLSVLLFISGLIFSKSKIRMIDVFGTQAMARFPLLIACLLSPVLFSEKISDYLRYKIEHKGDPVVINTQDMISFVLITIVLIATVIWMVLLMYKAYSVSCNMRGQKSVVTFIVFLILAEILSKIIIATLVF